MTYARAMAAKKRGAGEVVSIADNTPPAMNFLPRNSDTSNHPQWNHLVVPTDVVATLTTAAAPLISMAKRVVKRAGDMFFSGPETTPTKRNCAVRVRTQLARSDPAFTSILEEYEEEKNSQEIFEFSAWRRLGWSNDGIYICIYISTTSINWTNIRIVLG